MSYILDALRKAERDRRVSRVPTLATAHAAADSRRAAWIWPAAAGLAAVAVIVAYTVHWAQTRATRPEPVAEVAAPAKASSVVTPPRPDTSPTAPPSEQDQAAVASPPGPMAAPAAPGSAPAVIPPPSKSSGVPSGPPSGPLAPTPERAQPPRGGPAGPAAKRAAGGRTPGDLVAAAPTSSGSAPSSARPPAPASQPLNGEVRSTTSAPSVPPGPIDRASAAAPAPVMDAGTAPAVPPPAVAPVPAEGGVNRAAPASPPAPSQGPAGLALDVLVYSEIPAERLVFINGRKYVEGQAVDGGAVIEQITPEGAMLRYEGKQIVLRPKLNPYARPGSP